MFDYNYYKSNLIYPNIVAYARKDVNGDGLPENVYLTGIETPDSPYIQNITLVIQDQTTGKVINIPLEENDGYNPTLFLGDFTGSGVDDIMISINSGGSGGMMYYYIYSFFNNVPQLLFDFNVYNEMYHYTVTYKDYYTVEVFSEENNTTYLINISNKGTDYLSEIYNTDGTLREPISGFVNPISGLYPVDFNGDKKYELFLFQEVSGRYHADALGYMQNILKWQTGVFTQENQYLAIFGSDGQ